MDRGSRPARNRLAEGWVPPAFLHGTHYHDVPTSLDLALALAVFKKHRELLSVDLINAHPDAPILWDDLEQLALEGYAEVTEEGARLLHDLSRVNRYVWDAAWREAKELLQTVRLHANKNYNLERHLRRKIARTLDRDPHDSLVNELIDLLKANDAIAYKRSNKLKVKLRKDGVLNPSPPLLEHAAHLLLHHEHPKGGCVPLPNLGAKR